MVDPSQPRIGRRESEPHSLEVAYLHDVLSTNFSEHHVLLDLHHYFQQDEEEIDVQFDISFFSDVSIPYTLSSYRASDYQDKVPVLAINILSKSTWRTDVGENVDLCRALRIPVYLIFAPFDVASRHYRPPFVRVYFLMDDGSYAIKEQRNSCIDAAGVLIEQNIIDLEGVVPFRVGIEELPAKHEKNQSRYRLIIVRNDSPARFLTSLDLERQRAEKYLRILKDHGLEP